MNCAAFSPVLARTPAAVGIVFDLDNTLIASHIDFARMRQDVVSVLQQAGAVISSEALAWPVGRLAELAKEPGLPAGLFGQVWEVIDDYELAGMTGAIPEDGARETLEELSRQGHALAVLTNNSRDSARRALDEHDLQGFFRAILCRGDVPRLKPAPDGLQVAAALLGHPARLVMVGDSWLDGAAAAAAGALFVAVGRFRQRETPVPVWRQVADLPELAVMDWHAPIS